MPSSHGADARAARDELDRLLQASPELRAGLPAGFVDAAERFVARLLDANDRMNLTRVVSPADVARLHLLDALSALPILDELAPSRVVDLGSGGGVPGIVLALARPDVAWTMIDSVRKKADVLTGFREALGLLNVRVLSRRAEEVGRDPSWREGADAVTARAVAPLPVLAEYALPLLRVGGALVAWKGRIGADELQAGARAASILGGGDAELRDPAAPALGDHRFVVVPKLSATPAGYPRRPGEPSKRPLG